MTTLLKRNICNIDGTVKDEDVEMTYNLTMDSVIPLSLDVVEHGVMDGFAWVEEHHTTWVPWLLVLLFFWCITPKVTKIVYIHINQGEKIIDFDFVLKENMSVHDNIYNAPKELGINTVWFHIEN